MTRDRREAGRLLRACVRGEAWRRSSPAWCEARAVASAAATGVLQEAARGAHFHGVAGYVQRVAAGVEGAPAGVLAQLDGLRAGVLHEHLRATRDLGLLAGALGGQGIPWLVVKGPVLARLHGAPDLRAYSDLDVVVPAEAFPAALEALEQAGARPLASNWAHRLDVLAGEVPLTLPSGAAVDLHWHLLNDRALRTAFGLRMPVLLGRARPVDVAGRAVRTLDPADGLLHLALHTAMSGGNRLVWLKDVERVLLSDEPDPATVVARARETGLVLVLATVLDRVVATLGTRVPDALGGGLRGSAAWRRLAGLARHLPPPERARPGASVDRLVTRATRTDLRTSVRELARRSTRRTVHRPAPPAAPGEGGGRAGDAAARSAYLTAVARSASA